MRMAVNTIVKNRDRRGQLLRCAVFSESIAQFEPDYLRLTRAVAESCENHDLMEQYGHRHIRHCGYARSTARSA